jgi:hypothetical protein
MIKSVLQPPRRKNPEESNLENEVSREWVLFIFSDCEIPCPERHEYDRRSEVFQLGSAPPHFSVFMHFWTGCFLII